MIEKTPITDFSARKGAEEIDDPLEVDEAKRKDRAHLNDDRVHLPVGVVEWDFHQRFGDAQVRRGTYGQEFCQTFDNPKQNRQQERTHEASGLRLSAARTAIVLLIDN